MVWKTEGDSSSDGVLEFIAKVAPYLLSSRDAVLSMENLHPEG